MQLQSGEKFRFKPGIKAPIFCLGDEGTDGTIKYIPDQQWDLNTIPKVLTFLKHEDDVVVFKTNSYVFFAKILNQFKDIGEIVEKI